jgi:hypothetical protein
MHSLCARAWAGWWRTWLNNPGESARRPARRLVCRIRDRAGQDAPEARNQLRPVIWRPSWNAAFTGWLSVARVWAWQTGNGVPWHLLLPEVKVLELTVPERSGPLYTTDESSQTL